LVQGKKVKNHQWDDAPHGSAGHEGGEERQSRKRTKVRIGLTQTTRKGKRGERRRKGRAGRTVSKKEKDEHVT